MKQKLIKDYKVLYITLLIVIFIFGLSTSLLLNDSMYFVGFLIVSIVFNRLIHRNNNGSDFLIWRLYFILLIISGFRGLYYAENYMDYKCLVFNSFELILPILLAFTLGNINNLTLFYKLWLKWGIIFIFFTIPFIPGYQVGKSFTPILFLAIFFKDLTRKNQILAIIIILIGLLLNDGSRSVIVRSVLFIFISICTYFPFVIKLLKKITLITFFIPICFFIAATLFNFNVLTLGEDNTTYTIKDGGASGAGTDGTRNLTDDTRTGLYIETLLSATKNNYVLFGRTPARGHDSSLVIFGGSGHRGERNKDEIGILNTFNWFGIVGVILYGACFFYSIWLGLFRSRNVYTIYGAIMLQFFWIYSWIEEIQILRWDYLVIFLIVPFITSRAFREMRNNEVKMFIKRIIY